MAKAEQFDAPTEHARAVVKQERLTGEIGDLRQQLPALAVARARGEPGSDAKYAAATKDLATREAQLVDLAYLLDGLRIEAEAQQRRAEGLARLLGLHRDFEEEFRHRLGDARAKGPGTSSDTIEKLIAAWRTLSAVGHDAYTATGDRRYQQRAGLKELLGESMWSAIVAAGGSPNAPKLPITRSRAWAEALAAAKGEPAPATADVVVEEPAS
jgi:hypothetical protein